MSTNERERLIAHIREMLEPVITSMARGEYVSFEDLVLYVAPDISTRQTVLSSTDFSLVEENRRDFASGELPSEIAGYLLFPSADHGAHGNSYEYVRINNDTSMPSIALHISSPAQTDEDLKTLASPSYDKKFGDTEKITSRLVLLRFEYDNLSAASGRVRLKFITIEDESASRKQFAWPTPAEPLTAQRALHAIFLRKKEAVEHLNFDLIRKCVAEIIAQIEPLRKKARVLTDQKDAVYFERLGYDTQKAAYNPGYPSTEIGFAASNQELKERLDLLLARNEALAKPILVRR